MFFNLDNVKRRADQNINSSENCLNIHIINNELHDYTIHIDHSKFVSILHQTTPIFMYYI